MTDIDEFIEKEAEYFRPMLERSERASDDDRVRWRQETVRQRHERVSLEVYELCKGVVRYGPFKGMAISSAPWWGQLDLGSQCLGLYEKEILDYLMDLRSTLTPSSSTLALQMDTTQWVCCFQKR